MGCYFWTIELVFEPTSTQTYYSKGDIPFTIAGYSGSVSITPTGADWNTNMVQTSNPGVYTVKMTDTVNGTTTANITVCDYFDGTDCWMLGGDAESCTATCAGYTGLICKTGLWNADDTICDAFGGTVSNPLSPSDLANPYAPYKAGTSPLCYYRSNDISFSCGEIPELEHWRLCNCEI